MEFLKLPECCRSSMVMTMDSGRYAEFTCGWCGSTIYMKKRDLPKPQENPGGGAAGLGRKRDILYSHIEGR